MAFKFPKLRITINPNTGELRVSKITLKSIFNANLQEATKKAPPMPFVRNRKLKRFLKLLMSK
ncbi:MAG: hypothetical protein K0R48_857 [Gammaproteobacteria bacterium]|jgi:hypothetical protein|nr:hypothetical protein [Gammaproteobacteria bacterium]